MNTKNCCKCQSTTIIELSTIRNTTWCRQCFIDQINIKFFQGLKIAKEYCRPPPKRDGITGEPSSLVIHLNNDLNSFLILQFMRNYLNTNQDRSTVKWKSPIDFSTIEVVWIDLGSASPYLSPHCLSEAEIATEQDARPVNQDQAALRSRVESLGFTFQILKLDDLFEMPPSTEKGTSACSSSKCFVDLLDPNLPTKIMDTDPSFSTLPEITMKPLANTLRLLTQTSRRSFIESLINKRLLDFCKHKPRNKVLVKTVTSTQMAIDTLVGVSLGNGWSLDQQIGPSSYIDDVLICRPLAQIVDAELVQYAKLMELNHPYSSKQQTPMKNADIPAVITQFVVKLEENYPMTSSVINQTVNKIGKNKSVASSLSSSTTRTTITNGKDCSVTRTCPICQLSSDQKAREWKRSITLSSHESRPVESSNELADPTVAQQVDHDEHRPSGLKDQLCYACLVTFNDHQYLSHSSRSDHDWVQLPSYYRPIGAPFDLPGTQTLPEQPANHVQAILDQFLISD